MNRLGVKKTYKLYIGGNFVRTESGRSLPATSASGQHLDNICWASRKDFRDAVTAARPAFEIAWFITPAGRINISRFSER
jgi:acyl-CoA reductase-like NAD-dependent aldehyde dehydrogenase